MAPGGGRPGRAQARARGAGSREGLSLVNGTEPMRALLAFWVRDAVMVVQVAALCHR
jgi:histidine ammonia-lyase